MDFIAILSFVVIALISYLFSKDRIPSGSATDTDVPASPESRPAKKVPGTGRNKKRGFSGEFGELFEEIKMEFDRTFEKVEKKQADPYVEEDVGRGDIAKTKQKTPPPKKVLEKDVKKVAGGVYEGEIGKSETYISFDKKSVIKGIIMSEILQKPKSLKR